MICLTLANCIILSNSCFAFANTTTLRRDKESIIVSQEEEALLIKLQESRKEYAEKNKKIENHTKPVRKKETRTVTYEERENNDSFSRADILYYGERFKGYIDDEDDQDFFEIEFDEDGTVLFDLYSIPSGCDYDLTIYDEDYHEIDSSTNPNNKSEQIIIAVEANKTYYALIESYKGYDEEDYYYVTVDYVNPAYCLSAGVNYLANYVDTSDDAELFAHDMESIGFTTQFLDRIMVSDWDETLLANGGPRLLEADVIMLAGHGNSNGIFFNHKGKGGDYATGVTYGNSKPMTFFDSETNLPKETYQMAGLADYDVEDTVLAVLCGCKTASGGRSSFANMTSANRGVNCVFGWSDTIKDLDSEKWLSLFGYGCILRKYRR